MMAACTLGAKMIAMSFIMTSTCVIVTQPLHALNFCGAATTIPRYANEFADNCNGGMMVRSLLQWGALSPTPAIKAAVAQALAALCRCGFFASLDGLSLCDVCEAPPRRAQRSSWRRAVAVPCVTCCITQAAAAAAAPLSVMYVKALAATASSARVPAF